MIEHLRDRGAARITDPLAVKRCREHDMRPLPFGSRSFGSGGRPALARPPARITPVPLRR